MAAGQLNTPAHFQRRAAVGNDPDGRPVGDWGELLSRMAHVRARNAGGEESVGLRLEGRQGYEFKIRNDPQTRGISTADRIEVETGPYAGFYNIASISPFPPDPKYLLITAERGGPNG